MEIERINHPYLTAIKRTDISVPTRYLLKHDLLKGRILDYGCGFGFDTDELKRQGYDITGYDYYYRPDYPGEKFDTIICNYVLNVLEPYAQAEVMMNVTNLLHPKGSAFFAVRRDLKEEGSDCMPFISNTLTNAMFVYLSIVLYAIVVMNYINIIILTNCPGRKERSALSVVFQDV